MASKKRPAEDELPGEPPKKAPNAAALRLAQEVKHRMDGRTLSGMWNKFMSHALADEPCDIPAVVTMQTLAVLSEVCQQEVREVLGDGPGDARQYADDMFEVIDRTGMHHREARFFATSPTQKDFDDSSQSGDDDDNDDRQRGMWKNRQLHSACSGNVRVSVRYFGLAEDKEASIDVVVLDGARAPRRICLGRVCTDISAPEIDEDKHTVTLRASDGSVLRTIDL